MRDILFRGKRLDKKDEWVEGGIVHQTDFYGDSVDRYYIVDGTDTDDNIGPAYRVYPDTIGQYTGLTDKNDKRIFEGDIVSTVDGNYLIVCDDYTGFHFEMRRELTGGYIKLEPLSFYDCEVIGNIHDNPELLEVTE